MKNKRIDRVIKLKIMKTQQRNRRENLPIRQAWRTQPAQPTQKVKKATKIYFRSASKYQLNSYNWQNTFNKVKLRKSTTFYCSKIYVQRRYSIFWRQHRLTQKEKLYWNSHKHMKKEIILLRQKLIDSDLKLLDDEKIKWLTNIFNYILYTTGNIFEIIHR